ncbi:putative catalytic subunit of tRNA (adenine-N(1)-)- methyltransferase, which catalyzes the formation of N(1)- methyladenine at position 58 (m1A58) in initiator methionyl-tRNA [Lyophyllum shimeji]|uniref:tRNA (adenine(58)-N(1))-methyltransferase catalytic subunit TRM61 n=1 Tax=Lyophyllum shimeji TaxID=47721 RepID=A0A9P3UPW0_LYOSH|nr:putative catalytic subunit of tRNA (adenine-N(1)-)- methyltransferase, which catalyzes the formation of N(1)- methyladenine at position 58 (m1A58) in initiator methionyl-tRNA [Lyophyllum shimeji]
MWSTAREIAAGDLVIIWLTRDLVQPLIITPGKDFNSKFGHYRHADLVGIPYGSKVASRTGKGFIHVLRPTPELWTMALPHRTQILYLADIAFITSHLNIKRGSRVIEAGTGSGSFSHSVARTVGSIGHLWSYEFHEVRASKAREEFARHGMNDIVTLTHRNVCKDGFTVTDAVDAVFLDLPAPWEAVEHAKVALRKDRTTRICCFSPCMEQVMRTVNALNDAGFTEITMYETLLRPIDVSHVPVLQPVGEISEKLKQAERKREDKRLKQIAAGRQSTSKRKREDEGTPVKDQTIMEEAAEEAAGGSKRIKTDDEDGAPLDAVPTPAMDLDPHEESDAALPTTVASPPAPSPSPIAPKKISVSKVMPEVRGHTSYLTFASLQPFEPPAEPAPSAAAAMLAPKPKP